MHRSNVPTIRLSIIGLFLYALGAAAAASAILLPPHDAAHDRTVSATAATQLLQTGTLLLAPKDTWLNTNTTNYSTSTTLPTYTWPDYQVANAILMKFDLSALPVGALVTEATLELALVDSDGAAESTYTVTAHKVVGKNPDIAKATGYTADGTIAWTANSCCYNSVPLAQADISPAYDTQAIDKAGGFKAWTITTMVQEWLLNPATNFGLALNSDASKPRDRYRTFASMEHSDSSVRPFLKITFAAADVTPPSVAITAPTAGDVSGTVPLTASATDNVAVAGVQFHVNGTPVGPEQTASPYVFNWDTTTRSDGTYTLTAVARDTSGNAATSATVTATVKNGIVFLSPQDTSLNINANNYSADTVLTTYTWPDYKVANAVLLKFDLSALPPGAAVQEARLFLALVKSDTTSTSTYTVKAHKLFGRNPDVTKATGYGADGVDGWTPNACCYNNVPLAQADISPAYDTQAIDKAPRFKAWAITQMVQEWLLDPASNFGLLLNSDASQPRERYRFFASSEHTDPSLRPFLRIKYVPPPADTTPPTVSIMAPAPDTYISGVMPLAANATDDVGVAGVQFELNGAPLGGELTAEPYVINWDTSAVSDGEYILTAKTRDAAANAATSNSVRVKKDRTPPAVSITSPAAGVTVTGTITVSASASDNVGVVGVQFNVDGVNTDAEDTSAPYSYSLKTTALSDGNHTLTAVARDAAGNQTTAAGLTVNVSNVAPPPPSSILWSADHEEGNMSDWYTPSGGGEFNSGGGVSNASRDFAHSGAWSAKGTITTGVSAIRLFRWNESRANPQAYYSAWYYFPKKITSSAWGNNVFQFKSKRDSVNSDPFWDLNVRLRTNGNMYLTLNWWCGLTVEGPHRGESGCRTYQQTLRDLPVGQWVHIEAFLKQSSVFDGQIIVWQDGVEVFNQNSVKTRYPTNGGWGANDWSINNYGENMLPSSFTIYLDDAAISTARLGPGTSDTTPPSCQTSGASWQNQAFASQSGNFTAQFDATPNADNIDGVTGLAVGNAAAYTDLATIVRFNNSGKIDARNGGAYSALTSIPYIAGTTYRVRMAVNVPTRSYSVYVTPSGGSEQALGLNYAFRSEQAAANTLSALAPFTNGGTLQICNVTVSP